MSGSNEGLETVEVTGIPVPHGTSDPEPPDNDATDEEWSEYRTALSQFVTEWCETQERAPKTPGEAVWSDFTCDFCEKGLLNLSRPDSIKIRELLLSRDVHVISRRGYSRAQALVNCWSSEDCPLLNGNLEKLESPKDISSNDIPSNEVANVIVGVQERAEIQCNHENRANSNGGGESHGTSSGDVNSTGRSGSLQGLMKAFAGRKKYSGGWEEDLPGTVEVYEMSAKMCDLSTEQMLKGIPIMLEGPALTYFASNLKGSASYEAAIEGLVAWYTSEEQRTRLLREWQDARLSAWMRKNPEKSEITVFRDLSATLARIQRQLHVDYRKDRFLKDQLVAAADISHVSKALKEKAPLTAQEATQRIAALLSSDPNSAGRHGTEGEEAFYGLGQRYKGNAEKNLKYSAKKSKFQRNSSRRKLAKIKGCWVCGADHLAHKFHSKEEIQKALEKHKRAGAYVSAEDVVSVLLAADEEDDSESSESDSDDVDSTNAFLVEEIRDVNQEIEIELSNRAFLHTCGFMANQANEMRKMKAALKDQDRSSEFNGVLLDTGANRTSLMSLGQYRAYCREYGISAQLKKESKRVCGLGGSTRSIGMANITVPFPNFCLVTDIQFHIVTEDVPTLLSLKDLKRTGVELSIQRDCLTFMGREQKLVLENDFLYYRWAPDSALFTHSELVKLHRSFGHPSVSALYRVLKRARPNDAGEDVQKAIQYLTERCKTCVELGEKPKRFKLTVGAEESKFNSTIAADVMYLNKRPVLHVVDEATHFAAAIFLRKVSSKEVWKGLLRCWTHVYLGPPDYLKLDQGSSFTSKEFRGLAEAEGIKIIDCPIESPASMSHVERYHGPLRTAYEKLAHDLQGETKDRLLQMAVHCVNNTVGPEGFCPTMCVFGAMPRPARETPAPEQLERAKAIDSAMKAVQKDQAKRRIQFALKYRGPYGKERTDLDCLHFGAPVRVFRDTSKTWEGPFKFISKEGETVCVQLPHGRRIFRSHVVKSVKPENEVPSNKVHDTVSPISKEQIDSNISSNALDAMFGDGGFFLAKVSAQDPFKVSRKAELCGLTKAKVFKVVDRSIVPEGQRIYGTKWVDGIKTLDDGSTKYKSRLVAQNFRDNEARGIPTKAPTISRFGQRIALAIAAMNADGHSYVRDITQAYTQSNSELERDVYLTPPPEMQLTPGKVLLALKPLYGVPESGLHWFLTYSNHHIENLNMKSCTVDPCILYNRKGTNGQHKLPNVTILQVDDSFGCGNDHFLECEEKESKRFRTNPRQVIRIGDTCKFNGSELCLVSKSKYTLTQRSKLKELKVPHLEKDAVSTRAKIQYIATCSRPDLASATQLLTSAVSEPDSTAMKKLKEIVAHCQKTSAEGLNFVKLDKDTLKIVLFTDASFGNAVGLSSQAGFVVVLMDESGAANILHYGSKKCRRVTRSVMAAELLSLVNGFDSAFIIKHTVSEILDMDIPMDAFVDSRTTFNCVAKNSTTLEKRLQIDVAALRESLTRGELRCMGWIPGSANPADGLTKDKIPNAEHPLTLLMRNNFINIKPQGWLESR